eukprot:2771487-Rhodomonas_salina.1
MMCAWLLPSQPQADKPTASAMWTPEPRISSQALCFHERLAATFAARSKARDCRPGAKCTANAVDCI